MFENLIAQPAGSLLADDIRSLRLPPSVLFYGQTASGKLTAALETARVLSCINSDASWTCPCSSCSRHRLLSHPDLALVGSRDCTLEIRAASEAFFRNRGQASRFLFIRSIRKLMLRFSQSVQDTDDSKFQKCTPLLSDLEERLEELGSDRSLPSDDAQFQKMLEGIVSSAEKLEQDFLYDSIPVSVVRTVSSWARLTPAGKRKVVIIENADRMQDAARNAFLKVLEEPPENVVFILTTARRGAILPTILSRVRTYAFIDRSLAHQHEVIRRVFHDEPDQDTTLTSWFNSFLPVSPEAIHRAACSFLETTLLAALDEGKKPLPGIRSVLDSERGAGERSESIGSVTAIVSSLNKCKPALVWHLFLSRIARFMRMSLRSGAPDARETAIYAAWTALLRETLDSVDIYNISPASALERLSHKMKEAL